LVVAGWKSALLYGENLHRLGAAFDLDSAQFAWGEFFRAAQRGERRGARDDVGAVLGLARGRQGAHV
jgi:hypothetical protein